MKPAVSTLTISFEAPFWVGLYEQEEEGLYQVCKIPSLGQSQRIARSMLSPAALERPDVLPCLFPPAPCPGRGSNSQTAPAGDPKTAPDPAIGTKAQQALQLQHAQRVQTRKETARQKANPGPAPPGRPGCREKHREIGRTALRSLRLRRAVRRLPKRARARRGTEGVFQGEPICFERILKKRDGRHTQAACFFMVR